MLVRFWGTRGSLPRPLTAEDVRGKVREALAEVSARDIDTLHDIDRFIAEELDFSITGTYGGNTSCVEIDDGSGDTFVFDLGTGARALSETVIQRKASGGSGVVRVLMSHLHWDHMMGFPFFQPVYLPGHRIEIYGAHDGMEEAFRAQHAEPGFPVDFQNLAANIDFTRLDADREHDIAGYKVRLFRQRHGGDSFGYRIERDGKSLVYSTDGEHKENEVTADYPYVDFIRGVDLLIFDAMYSLAENVSVKEDWGHSNNIVAVELAQLAKVKQLCMYHHEPMHNDSTLAEILQETIRFNSLSGSGRKIKAS